MRRINDDDANINGNDDGYEMMMATGFGECVRVCVYHVVVAAVLMLRPVVVVYWYGSYCCWLVSVYKLAPCTGCQ